jgi:hypothetical protein
MKSNRFKKETLSFLQIKEETKKGTAAGVVRPVRTLFLALTKKCKKINVSVEEF